MQKRWWEDILSFFCDFWWVFALLLAVGLALYFTREMWMPLLGIA